MTRFAWLQARAQTLGTFASLAAVAVVAAITGVRLSHLYHQTAAACAAGDCGIATGQFLAHYSWLQNGFELLLRLAPAIVGIFWGAPLLAREFETGTFRLVWTQGVGRGRWLITKLLLVGASGIAAVAVFTLTTTWWFRAVDRAGGNPYALSDRRDLAPVGYALFAFAAGALLGAVIRRTVPAMAATIGLFAFTRVAVAAWVRPHLLAPVHASLSILSAGGVGFTDTAHGTVELVTRGADIPKAWVQSSRLVTDSGQIATAAQRVDFVRQHCPTIAHPLLAPGQTGKFAADPNAFEACRQQAARTFHLAVTYQPANRYWTLQWLEAGVFAGLALAALAGCYWWVTRRAN